MENDGTLRFVDTRTRRPAGRRSPCRATQAASSPRSSRFDQLRYSPDGSRIAVGGCEPVILDATTHRVLAHLQIGSDDRLVYGLRFSPDGRTLYAVGRVPRRRRAARAAVRRAHAAAGSAARRARRRDGFATLMLTRDGRALVTVDAAEGGTVDPRRPHAAGAAPRPGRRAVHAR